MIEFIYNCFPILTPVFFFYISITTLVNTWWLRFQQNRLRSDADIHVQSSTTQWPHTNMQKTLFAHHKTIPSECNMKNAFQWDIQI